MSPSERKQTNATLVTHDASDASAAINKSSILPRVLLENSTIEDTVETKEAGSVLIGSEDDENESDGGDDGGDTTNSTIALDPTVAPSTLDPTVAPSTLSPSTAPTNMPTLPPPIYRYAYYCNLVGLGTEMCQQYGRPMIPSSQYHVDWEKGWTVWKSTICDRMTYGKKIKVFKDMKILETEAIAKTSFFDSFAIMDNDNRHWLPIPTTTALRPPHVGVILDTTSSLVRLDRLQSLVKLFAKFDFDIVQLRIAGSKGFTIKTGKQPNLAYSMLSNPDRAVEPLRPFEMRRFVEDAHALGIQVIPEISFTSNAAGWYGGGFLAECPQALCNGDLVAHDLRKPGLFPVIFSLLEEVREIFSSQFLHLGHDNRHASEACFAEAGIDIDVFDRFERKLSALLDFTEIDKRNVLRYVGAGEADRAVHRAGAIRHYPSDFNIEDIKDNAGASPFFVTVNIFDGNLMDVYTHTLQLLALKPSGIVAELRYLWDSEWEEYQIVPRLIAFALGTVQGQIMTEGATFLRAYTRFCQLLHVPHMNCSELPSMQMMPPVQHVTESAAWTNAECELRTEMKELCLSKTVNPFYVTTAGLQVSNDTVLFYRGDEVELGDDEVDDLDASKKRRHLLL
jgi:hypothetical protein